MSGVFQNIDPSPPHRPTSVYPRAFGAGGGEDTLAGWRGGGGSIFWKTLDTALYSTYVSTLCAAPYCDTPHPTMMDRKQLASRRPVTI